MAKQVRNMDTQVIVKNRQSEDDEWEIIFDGSFGDYLWKELETEPEHDHFLTVMDANIGFLTTEEDFHEVEMYVTGIWRIELKVEE